MNYTKGEWKAHGGLIETEYSPNGAVIAVANKATEKWESNAPLIAAAPEMYEALKGLLQDYSTNPNRAIFYKACRKAREALAKAEGK